MKTFARHKYVLAVAFAITSLLHAGIGSGIATAAVPDTGLTGTVAGHVTAGDGVSIRNAVISLQGEHTSESGHTDGAGNFAIPNVAAGTYAIRVSALGFNPLGPRPISVQRRATTDLALALIRSSSSLATIGNVRANGGEALSTSSAPVTIVNPQTYAVEGFTRVSDILQDDMSTTIVHPAGGGHTILPTSVALRGPDPTETLVDIDGHQINSGSTGDFDLSLLDPADYSSIELVKGISPSSLVGPNTIDGAINIRTLEPTLAPHGLLRLSAGSFNSFAQTLQSTGTVGRLGYALSLHGTTSAGDVNGPVYDANSNAPAEVGSQVDGKTALGKLRYAFGTSGGAYAEFSFHDQAVTRDISAALSAYPDPPVSGPPGLPVVAGFAGSSLAAHNVGYGLDVRLPVGGNAALAPATGNFLFRHYTSLLSQSVVGSAADTSPYLFNNRDRIDENTLEFDKQFANGTLTLQYSIRKENLLIADANLGSGDINLESIVRRSPLGASLVRHAAARNVAAVLTVTDDDDSPPAPAVSTGQGNTLLTQTQRAAVLRYVYDPTAKLHVAAAAYYSDYSIFGHEIDPRFGLVYTPDARLALRFSLGTTYQSPQLPELYVPSVLPAPVAGLITTGNPNLQPDRATEYGFGASRILETGPHRSEVSVDLYRVNLRGPATTYQPPGELDSECGAVAAGGDGTPCSLSYAVNAGNGVYQGVELGAQRQLAPYVSLRAGYAVRSAFLTSVPSFISDGSLVPYQQSLGLPLQKATLAVTAAPPRGLTFRAAFVYEGAYNELNEPPFATVAASVGYRWPGVELTLSGTNLTDVYNGHFTTTGGGVPQATLTGPQATDAYALQGTAFTISLARRF